jgi:hypothetical protein
MGIREGAGEAIPPGSFAGDPPVANTLCELRGVHP